MKSRESVPLNGSPGRPYIESEGSVTYRERGSPDRAVVSLREGKTSKLGLQGRSSCLGISARPGMVVVTVLCPRHGMAWYDATVLVVMALLARWPAVLCDMSLSLPSSSSPIFPVGTVRE